MAKYDEKPAIGRYASTDDRGRRTVLLRHVPFDEPQTVRTVTEAVRAAHNLNRPLRPGELAWAVAGAVCFIGGMVLSVRLSMPWSMVIGVGAFIAGAVAAAMTGRGSRGEVAANLRRRMLEAGLCPSCCYRLPDRADESGGAACSECGAWWRREGEAAERTGQGHMP